MPRKTTKTISPVANTSGMVTFTFQVPVSELAPSVSERNPETNGHYWQLPYSIKGEMINGKTVSEFTVSRGKITVPTAKGRAAYAKKHGKRTSGKTVKVYTKEQIAELMKG
tara:strand:+ start:421 stop:753 length:333 start_codon:yes stop_codon:yes gene_type:complete